MYVLGLPACLRAALSRSVVGSHVGHTRAARGGAFGVERPETPFQTIIGTRNRDRNTGQPAAPSPETSGQWTYKRGIYVLTLMMS